MTDYRADDGERFTGAEIFGYMKSVTWTVVAFDNDEGVIVVEDEDGEVIVLREIPGTEQSTTGPHIYAADDE